MTKNRLLALAVCAMLAAAMFTSSVSAQTDEDRPAEPALDKFLKEFDAKRTDLKTYTARFRQVKFNSLFKEYSEPATGILTYKQPGRVLWLYEKPDEMTVLLRDRSVKMYIADMAQMDVYDFREDTSMKALFLGFDQTGDDLKKAYTLTLFDAGEKHKDSWAVKLKPRDETLSAYFKDVSLWLRKTDFAVARIVIEGPGDSGNRTEIDLIDIEPNKDVPDTVFDLKVPLDTAIIQHTSDELRVPTIKDE